MVRRALLGVAVTLTVCLAVAAQAVAEPSEHPFEVLPGSFHLVQSTAQAGAHEDLTTEFDFAHNAAGHTFNDVRTIVVNLPAGFTGNNTAIPTCTFAQLLNHATKAETDQTLPPRSGNMTQCPPASQAGTITFDLAALDPSEPVERVTTPLYNMEVTSYGVAAQFGFHLSTFLTAFLDVSVRPGDAGLTVTSPNIEESGEVRAIAVTVWGVPAAHEHDAERGFECLAGGGNNGELGRPNPHGGAECFGGGLSADIPLKPYLSNPTSCAPLTGSIEVDSWEHPLEWSRAETTVGPVTGCEEIHFDPAIEVAPTTRSAESSSGLDVTEVVPQAWSEAFTLATSNLKDTKVVLPEGYTINPSAGNGLVGCTPVEYAAETSSSAPGAGCPPESKLGTVEIETPVLAEKIAGNVYLAQPYENPFSEPGHPNGSLLALYVVAKAPDRGVIIKAAGRVEPNPVTGQLTTTFENTPQQPFSHLSLKFRQGAASPLVSPPACGSYTTVAELTPWSAPAEPRFSSSTLQIEDGVRGGPCPPGGTPPLRPTVLAGTESNAASSYSPFYLRIAREDGEQELTGFSTVMPPGLTGNLTGIPFCPDAAIEAARGRTGQAELTEPSCPAASKVGHTIVEAGVGSVLAQTPGSLYLAGPFHGAPFSLVSITSATVGPFDLGTVVIRFALTINPTTAQVEVSPTGSEPIPHIIKGIVTHVRDIRAYLDRPNFIINPTSCERMSIANVITGAGADPSNPADQDSVATSTPFQTADCSSLQFKPDFQVSTSGKTSKADGASLTAKLTVPATLGTESNIREVKVELPKQLPSRLTTLQKACIAAQFDANPAGCPAASVVGHAKAITPILPVPLEGPAYFVSHGGEAFPSLVLVLQGYGVTIDLVGTTFISKAGITSSTFKTVPDAPVGSFELTLPEGRDSALAADGSLCASKLVMPTTFLAQNGVEIHQSTKIAVTGCPKHKAKVKKASRRKHTAKGKHSGHSGRRG
jgi:hypothetical protein